MKKQFSALLFLFLVLGAPLATRAQAPQPEIVIIHTVADSQASSLALTTFFVVQDENGRPIPKDQLSIESASVQLLTSPTKPISVEVTDPRTPIKVALLVDASGSMAAQIGEGRTIIDAVRESAKKAIDIAPDNAFFSVFKFSQVAVDADFRPLSEGFTQDKDLIKRDIDAIDAIPNGVTCLYNATYKVTEYLAQEVDPNPQERRAIILFTDGKNEGDGCEARSADDVIAKATSGNLTPIYIVGFCSSDSCDNVDPSIKDKTGGDDIAAKTSAFSILSNSGNIDSAFTDIMNGLNSQSVIRTNVFARKGQNQAVLSINLRDRDLPLTATFNFSSDRDYAPAPTFDIIPKYTEKTDSYSVTLNIANPESVRQVDVTVWNQENGGVQISSAKTFANPAETLQFEQPTIDFQANNTYYFRIAAQDRNGAAITNDKGGSFLINYPFAYNPKLDFSIVSVEPDWQKELLLIDVDVSGAGGRTLSFKGVVTDKETGQSDSLAATTPQNGQLRVAMPKLIRQAGAERGYMITLQLEDGEKIIERVKERTIAAPVVAKSPWGTLTFILIGLALALVMFGVLRLRKSRSKRTAILQPSPYTPPTQHLSLPTQFVDPRGATAGATIMHVPEPAKPQVRVRIKLVSTPNITQPREEIITTFPCILGREIGTNSSASYFIIPDDGKLSRAHAEIVFNGNAVSIVDHGSTNGTFIGPQETKLAKDAPAPLVGRTKVRLGFHTYLEIEPLGMMTSALVP